MSARRSGVCGRAYIVNQGTVIASGTAEEVLANPQVREVYLGESFRSVTLLCAKAKLIIFQDITDAMEAAPAFRKTPC